MELPREIAVIGTGTMGAGIARMFAEAGCSVRLCARRATSLEAARPRLGGHPVELTISAKDALTGAALVIETIEEAVDPKRALFALAEEVFA
jgi:3-hydroxyacyl-CoA dehydrogenase